MCRSPCLAGFQQRPQRRQGQTRRRYALCLVLLLLIVIGPLSGVQGETLQEYALRCERATGVDVPAFTCDDRDSTLVPFNNGVDSNGKLLELEFGPFGPDSDFPALYEKVQFGAGGKCDQPDRLNRECDPGSRFHVLKRTADAFVVAHCRKKGNEGNTWGDIAVIQHNTTNGATCFFQEGPRDKLANEVKAPRDPGPNEWNSPSVAASQGCVACHDNGPIIRSPYLSQITGPNKLPGACGGNTFAGCDIGLNGPTRFNGPMRPYAFVGEDFADWRAYQVDVAYRDNMGNITKNLCTTCHRMGVSNLPSGGTARDFGLRATATSEVGKNPHSPASPIWMTIDRRNLPEDMQHSETNEKLAQDIRACALRVRERPLPNELGCTITLFAEAFRGDRPVRRPLPDWFWALP
jgi:hypothetical protein